ncbi:MAG: TerB family tellurite resistance protein [Desulfuromonadaceae bacterium]|jgi:uncharacterized tellurite resistance protein B-like protein
MLKLLKKILGADSGKTAEADGFPRVQIATCALLLEMAHADEEFNPAESVLVETLLQDRFSLSAEITAELMHLAHVSRQASPDLYHYAREINAHFSPAEKLELIEALWRIVYADGRLDKYEEYLMRQVTRLLRLTHGQMIEAKLKVLAEAASGSSS